MPGPSARVSRRTVTLVSPDRTKNSSSCGCRCSGKLSPSATTLVSASSLVSKNAFIRAPPFPSFCFIATYVTKKLSFGMYFTTGNAIMQVNPAEERKVLK